MEMKIFRDTLPQAGTSCTVKAELPLETEILISDYLPPVFKLVKCFVVIRSFERRKQGIQFFVMKKCIENFFIAAVHKRKNMR